MQIGMIDLFLDEWHANNYPRWIRENAAKTKRNVELAYAWAEMDNPNGRSTEEWCNKHDVQQLGTVEEVVERSDCLIVLAPDHPEHHERLARKALMSGKPVYVDKTFSPDLKSGMRMFDLAETHHTPLFSSSALRFGLELSNYITNMQNKSRIEQTVTSGPGTYANYSVHQFEMVVAVMGVGAQRMKSLSSKNGRLLVIEYEHDRQASIFQMDQLPFHIHIQQTNGKGVFISEMTDMFPRLMNAVLEFFQTGTSPVAKQDTLEIMALIEAGKKALDSRDTWITVSSAHNNGTS